MLVLYLFYNLFSWFFSIYLLRKWNWVKQFLLINLVFILILVFTAQFFIESDPKGLGLFFKRILIVFLHSTSMLIFSIFKYFKLKNEEKT